MRVIFQTLNDDLGNSRDAAVAAHGPFPLLTVAALATKQIEIGTGVAIAFSRTPLGVATDSGAHGGAGLGMARVAGEVADGVRLHPFSTRRYLAENNMGEIEHGLARADCTSSKIENIS
ncbi:MAG: hypothetical protein ACI8PT_000369 [Gammaproteobacteria bacterium]|jgi:hypothetical protein